MSKIEQKFSVSQESDDLTDALKTINIMQDDHKQLVKELDGLKKSNASLRGYNTLLKKKVEQYKQLDKEGDELNEQKAARIDSLKKSLDEALLETESVAKELDQTKDALKTAREQIDNLYRPNIYELTDKLCALQANIEWYNSKPWYYRMFKKFPTEKK